MFYRLMSIRRIPLPVVLALVLTVAAIIMIQFTVLYPYYVSTGNVTVTLVYGELYPYFDSHDVVTAEKTQGGQVDVWYTPFRELGVAIRKGTPPDSFQIIHAGNEPIAFYKVTDNLYKAKARIYLFNPDVGIYEWRYVGFKAHVVQVPGTTDMYMYIINHTTAMDIEFAPGDLVFVGFSIDTGANVLKITLYDVSSGGTYVYYYAPAYLQHTIGYKKNFGILEISATKISGTDNTGTQYVFLRYKGIWFLPYSSATVKISGSWQ